MGRGEATGGELVPAKSLWGMLFTDVARVISQSPAQLRKRIGVIVVVCVAFGLTVLKAQDGDNVFTHEGGIPEVTAMFSVEAAGQVYN